MNDQFHHVDIIAIGASAGGIGPLCRLLQRLPKTLPATVLVTVHRSPFQPSHLVDILRAKSQIKVLAAQEAGSLLQGECLVSPPDKCLSITPDMKIHLVRDSFYRGHSIDVLFNSLARCAGKRAIGIVLSGALKDGTLGLKAIKEAGGLGFVQSPADAEFPDMPTSAIESDGLIDFVGTAEEMADEICHRLHRLPLASSC